MKHYYAIVGWEKIKTDKSYLSDQMSFNHKYVTRDRDHHYFNPTFKGKYINKY